MPVALQKGYKLRSAHPCTRRLALSERNLTEETQCGANIANGTKSDDFTEQRFPMHNPASWKYENKQKKKKRMRPAAAHPTRG